MIILHFTALEIVSINLSIIMTICLDIITLCCIVSLIIYLLFRQIKFKQITWKRICSFWLLWDSFRVLLLWIEWSYFGWRVLMNIILLFFWTVVCSIFIACQRISILSIFYVFLFNILFKNISTYFIKCRTNLWFSNSINSYFYDARLSAYQNLFN